MIHFFVKEKKIEQKEENDNKKALEVIVSLKGFFTNKNLRFLLIFLLTYKIG